MAGKDFPAGVRYLGDEDFGKWAWSQSTIERAFEILMKIGAIFFNKLFYFIIISLLKNIYYLQ